MTLIKRFQKIFTGLLLLAAAYILVSERQYGYLLVVAVLAISLLVYGLKTLFYYFTMAIHMVDGRIILYESIILLDLGLFSVGLSTLPKTVVIIYLVVYYLFFGGIQIYNALCAKKIQAPYIGKLIHGIISSAIAVICVIFYKDEAIVTYVFAFGLCCSAAANIISAFKKHAAEYIPSV